MNRRIVREHLSRLRSDLRTPLRRRDGRQFGSTITPADGSETSEPLGEMSRYLAEPSGGRGIRKWEHYAPVYERHLTGFRDRPINLLEIGIYAGGSLDMWRHLIPEAHIYGLDIDERCSAFASPGTDILIGDQGDPAFWDRTLSGLPLLDVVIDDGGHLGHQQIATAKAVLPRISPGGVYICEDIHHENNPFLDWIEGLSRNLHAWDDTDRLDASGFQAAIDSVHLYPFMAVIEVRRAPIRELRVLERGTDWLG